MARVLVVVEHRQGEIRDATFELITLALQLRDKYGLEPAAVVMGKNVEDFSTALSKYIPEVIRIESDALENFQFETYAEVLKCLLKKEAPLVTLVPHSSFGMELFPRLSVEISLPCATDVVEVEMEQDKLIVLRSIYNGKIDSRLALAPSGGYLVTVRSGSYSPADEGSAEGSVRDYPCPPFPDALKVEFVEYREAPAGEVDITQAPVLFAIGRGIKDEENVEKARELADLLGVVLACSRPVVDKHWMGKERQVGTSGKTVKPKVYLSMGISGAFQHVAGVKGAGVFIAVNRDPKAPIFRVADYGVVGDMYKIMSAMREKLA
ncbi:MAG: electron transfer flavoprotein subunit alpha/FixB family protein [Candidatus Krumholzibacteria bacterium]|nr:electron transfer flavoprotein subunit alpha/FixB family protein [Candidatus Krumholzibacteria bacterium]